MSSGQQRAPILDYRVTGGNSKLPRVRPHAHNTKGFATHKPAGSKLARKALEDKVAL